MLLWFMVALAFVTVMLHKLPITIYVNFSVAYPLVIINDSVGVRSIYWNRSGSIRLLSIVSIESHWNEFKCKTTRPCVREREIFSSDYLNCFAYVITKAYNRYFMRYTYHQSHFLSILFPSRFVRREKKIVVYYRPNCIRLNWWKSLTILMVQLINRHVSSFVCRRTVEIKGHSFCLGWLDLFEI